MLLFYNIGISLYLFSIRLGALFGNPKAVLWINGRKNLLGKIKEKLKGGEKRVWFHCSSLGEFEQGRPLIEKWKMKNAKWLFGVLAAF